MLGMSFSKIFSELDKKDIGLKFETFAVFYF